MLLLLRAPAFAGARSKPASPVYGSAPDAPRSGASVNRARAQRALRLDQCLVGASSSGTPHEAETILPGVRDVVTDSERGDSLDVRGAAEGRIARPS